MNTSEMDPINTSYIFPFEKSFSSHEFYKYMQQRWTDSFVYSTLYFVVIFGCQFYMRDRNRFELRPYLAVWSGILAVYSILGTIRTVPELIWALSEHGFEYSYCNNSYLDQGRVSAFWGALFVMSKAFELGDTIFIVLRKQPLIFLHWYHHITVLIYSWSSYVDQIANARYFMVTNYTVHSIMYSYYALRAMKILLPKLVSMLITSLQIAQMAWGIIIAILSYIALSSGQECVTNYSNILFCLLLYFSYLLLFANYFYKTYAIHKPLVHKKTR